MTLTRRGQWAAGVALAVGLSITPAAATQGHGSRAVIGPYHLVTGAPAHPQEDEDGWSCFTDGNQDCGPNVRKARGFGKVCVYFTRDYVMCADGSVYVLTTPKREATR